MGTPIRHPLVDEITARVVRIESRARVVRLSAPLADLLEKPVLAGRVVVLVTPETSRLTIGLRSALMAVGGMWLVTTGSGFRDGITGIDHRSLDEAAAAPSPSEDDDAPAMPVESTATAAADVAAQVSVDVTVLHTPDADAAAAGVLGGALEALCDAIGGYRPRAWGRSEPLEMTWDRWVMTEDARHRAPHPTRIIVEGENFSAAITARMTGRGFEETIALTADIPGGPAGLDSVIGRLETALGQLTRTSLPTFALVLAREGEPDRCFRPVTYPPPNPLVLLIGAPSVRRLELDEAIFAGEQDVVVVGAPARPAYLLPLWNSQRSGWKELNDALDSVGSERIKTLVEPPLL
ncbi:MAG: hypothetical protein JWP75_336, partial [Frondihabitans sp.]|nr:hypothetical protein [Frondihabitans sp.]